MLRGPLNFVVAACRKQRLSFGVLEGASLAALSRHVPIVTRPAQAEIQREPASDRPLIGTIDAGAVNRGFRKVRAVVDDDVLRHAVVVSERIVAAEKART